MSAGGGATERLPELELGCERQPNNRVGACSKLTSSTQPKQFYLTLRRSLILYC